MKSERIQVQHLEEQTWMHLREFREDIERVINDGTQPEDESLIRAVFNYTLARMRMADFDLEGVWTWD